MKRDYIYGLCFSLINLLDAIILVLTIGLYDPNFVMSYASWYMSRTTRKKKLALKQYVVYSE